MPELPEVEMVRRRIEVGCVGRTISRVKVLDAAILDGTGAAELRRRTEGREVRGASRHGKQLFLELDEGLVTIHLGMTGDVSVLGKEGRVPPHARTLFRFEDGGVLAYDDPRKFGAIGLASSVRGFISAHDLGPDALAATGRYLAGATSRSGRPVKALLLDQHVLAGVGNLYADEALFQARVHPLRPANSIDQGCARLLSTKVREVLKASIDVGADFSLLPEGYLLRQREQGAECPRGNGSIASLRIGGRTSCFCPVCQSLP